MKFLCVENEDFEPLVLPANFPVDYRSVLNERYVLFKRNCRLEIRGEGEERYELMRYPYKDIIPFCLKEYLQFGHIMPPFEIQICINFDGVNPDRKSSRSFHNFLIEIKNIGKGEQY